MDDEQTPIFDEDVIKVLNKHVTSISKNESIAAIIREEIKSAFFDKPSRSYYYLTDLCDPAQHYWKTVSPDSMKKSPELARRLFRGKTLHKLAGIWFKRLEGFVIDEGKVDGVFVGIPGVRGSIDFLIGNSILEFKTKDKNPSSVEEIFLNFPHDLEQLAFYSVLHPSHPMKNYLVFMENSQPNKLKAFLVKIKDIGKIKSLLIDRMKKLDRALEEKTPSILGRSRYHGQGCRICKSGLFDCESIESLSTDVLESAIEISYDSSFTEDLEKVRKDSNLPWIDLFLSKDILLPREFFKESVLGKSSEYVRDIVKDEYKICLKNIIDQISSLKLSFEEREMIKNSLLERRLFFGFKWIKLPSSKTQEGSFTPYLLNPLVNVKHVFTSPPPYHIAELAMISAAHGKDNGLIFTIYPKIKNFVQVFEVQFSSKKEIMKDVRKVIELLETSKTSKNIEDLPPNPPWVSE